MWSRAIHGVRLCVARRLAAVRLHRWNAADQNDGWLSKRRTQMAELLIPPGNLYLRVQDAPSQVLPCRAWTAWELIVAERLGREVRVTADQTGVEFPRLPGGSLEAILRTKELSLIEKLRAISEAAIALRKLHQAIVTTEGNTEWPLSHGDATCRNVMVDLTANRAQWIDFDMRHRWHLTPEVRRADDLRALLWSSAACLNSSEYRACVEALCSGYAEPDIVHEVQRQSSGQSYPTVFQLGQAPLTAANLAHLRQAVRTIV